MLQVKSFLETSPSYASFLSCYEAFIRGSVIRDVKAADRSYTNDMVALLLNSLEALDVIAADVGLTRGQLLHFLRLCSRLREDGVSQLVICRPIRRTWMCRALGITEGSFAQLFPILCARGLFAVKHVDNKILKKKRYWAITRQGFLLYKRVANSFLTS